MKAVAYDLGISSFLRCPQGLIRKALLLAMDGRME
ncbi:hypothetical protein NGA_0217900, partial [Nannochloropsis gaditana CCMP526]